VRRGRQNSPAERFITADGRGVPSLAAKQIGIPFLTNLSIAGHGFPARNLPPEQKPRCEAASRGFHWPSPALLQATVRGEPRTWPAPRPSIKNSGASSLGKDFSFHCPAFAIFILLIFVLFPSHMQDPIVK